MLLHRTWIPLINFVRLVVDDMANSPTGSSIDLNLSDCSECFMLKNESLTARCISKVRQNRHPNPTTETLNFAYPLVTFVILSVFHTKPLV